MIYIPGTSTIQKKYLSSEMLQNFPYLQKKKTHSFLISSNSTFLPYDFISNKLSFIELCKVRCYVVNLKFVNISRFIQIFLDVIIIYCIYLLCEFEEEPPTSSSTFSQGIWRSSPNTQLMQNQRGSTNEKSSILQHEQHQHARF